jgi:hypothetical protein
MAQKHQCAVPRQALDHEALVGTIRAALESRRWRPLKALPR